MVAEIFQQEKKVLGCYPYLIFLALGFSLKKQRWAANYLIAEGIWLTCCLRHPQFPYQSNGSIDRVTEIFLALVLNHQRGLWAYY